MINVKYKTQKRHISGVFYDMHAVVEEVITIFENKNEYIYIPDLRKNTSLIT